MKQSRNTAGNLRGFVLSQFLCQLCLNLVFWTGKILQQFTISATCNLVLRESSLPKSCYWVQSIYDIWLWDCWFCPNQGQLCYWNTSSRHYLFLMFLHILHILKVLTVHPSSGNSSCLQFNSHFLVYFQPVKCEFKANGHKNLNKIPNIIVELESVKFGCWCFLAFPLSGKSCSWIQ